MVMTSEQRVEASERSRQRGTGVATRANGCHLPRAKRGLTCSLRAGKQLWNQPREHQRRLPRTGRTRDNEQARFFCSYKVIEVADKLVLLAFPAIKKPGMGGLKGQ